MSVRLKDIAQALGLSISTVNAALQDRSDISVSTRQRVQEKVREMNYRPNWAARSLVTQKTDVFGVIVPDLSRSFFTEVVKGIDEISSAAKYHLLLFNTDENPARESEETATLISKQVDGLIIASSYPPGSSAVWTALANSGVPFVLVDRCFADVNFVGGDDVKIGKLATLHLLDQGYRRVAHIRGPNISTAIGRLKGYKKALQLRGVPFDPEYVVEAQYHEESGGAEAMQKLLRLKRRPDAVFAASDPIAIGALQAAQRAGLELPNDLGLVGVGNARYSTYLQVPLSTVDQNRREIGRAAASLLLELIDGRQLAKPKRVLIEPELIVRLSSCRSHPGRQLKEPQSKAQSGSEAKVQCACSTSSCSRRTGA